VSGGSQDVPRSQLDIDEVDARATSLIGRVISGRYRIEAPIAVGGMGTVFRGEHLLMRKRVAIKILHAETEGLPGLVAQVEREAIAGAHVSHPNVADGRCSGPPRRSRPGSG
jgi:serine/threonine-protein kinase